MALTSNRAARLPSAVCAADRCCEHSCTAGSRDPACSSCLACVQGADRATCPCAAQLLLPELQTTWQLNSSSLSLSAAWTQLDETDGLAISSCESAGHLGRLSWWRSSLLPGALQPACEACFGRHAADACCNRSPKTAGLPVRACRACWPSERRTEHCATRRAYGISRPRLEDISGPLAAGRASQGRGGAGAQAMQVRSLRLSALYVSGASQALVAAVLHQAMLHMSPSSSPG